MEDGLTHPTTPTIIYAAPVVILEHGNTLPEQQAGTQARVSTRPYVDPIPMVDKPNLGEGFAYCR